MTVPSRVELRSNVCGQQISAHPILRRGEASAQSVSKTKRNTKLLAKVAPPRRLCQLGMVAGLVAPTAATVSFTAASGAVAGRISTRSYSGTVLLNTQRVHPFEARMFAAMTAAPACLNASQLAAGIALAPDVTAQLFVLPLNTVEFALANVDMQQRACILDRAKKMDGERVLKERDELNVQAWAVIFGLAAACALSYRVFMLLGSITDLLRVRRAAEGHTLRLAHRSPRRPADMV